MTLAVRCPNCGALFRVTSEQLDAHDGDVRCGRCFAVFDGLHELSLPADATTSEAEAAAGVRIEPGIRSAAGTRIEPEFRAEPPPAAGAAAATAADVHSSPAKPAEQDGIAAPGVPLAEASHVVPPAAPDVPPAAARDALPSSAPKVSPLSATGASPFIGPPLPPSVAADAQPAVAASVPDPALRSGDTPAAGDTTPLVPALDPDFLSGGRAQTRRRRQLWSGGALLLALLVVVQLLLLFRVDLAARHPGFKPILTGLCDVAGCSVPLPQRPDKITIESSDLSATDPAHPDRVAVSVTLRNRGSVTMGYPALDLTLTDDGNRPVARRIFMPKQYLKPDQDARAGIAPDAEVSVRLMLDISGLDASGFRLELLPASGA